MTLLPSCLLTSLPLPCRPLCPPRSVCLLPLLPACLALCPLLLPALTLLLIMPLTRATILPVVCPVLASQPPPTCSRSFPAPGVRPLFPWLCLPLCLVRARSLSRAMAVNDQVQTPLEAYVRRSTFAAAPLRDDTGVMAPESRPLGACKRVLMVNYLGSTRTRDCGQRRHRAPSGFRPQRPAALRGRHTPSQELRGWHQGERTDRIRAFIVFPTRPSLLAYLHEYLYTRVPCHGAE